MNAGATPQVTMSAMESSCSPMSEVLPVMRAILPSKASKIMPKKMRKAAIVSAESLVGSMLWGWAVLMRCRLA